jgi:hypothetical protein
MWIEKIQFYGLHTFCKEQLKMDNLKCEGLLYLFLLFNNNYIIINFIWKGVIYFCLIIDNNAEAEAWRQCIQFYNFKQIRGG